MVPKSQALTCLLAAVGGAVFAVLNLPLPWMLGAMAFTLVAAMLKVPVQAPEKLRPYTVAVIGVMLGSGFTTQTFDHIPQWSLSLMFLSICVALQASVVGLFYVKAGQMRPVTALFSAMPGGVVEMMEIGKRYGGDERTIVLIHAARIVLVIAMIAFWFRVVLGHDVSGVAPLGKGHSTLTDLAILFACGVIGSIAGLGLSLPAPTFLGPMVLSAAVHMLGWTTGSPPVWLIICAQVLLGSIVGGRFVGVAPRFVLKAFGLSAVATVMMLAIAIGLAQALHGVLQQTPEQILLAYAPGGLTEMSLVSLSMGADVAFIATHHLFRVILLLSIAGSLLAWIAGLLTKTRPALDP
ncbi:AbrB family transcriptional regulator [Aliiroseovarius halocynthiae]|nr:AbrB family transcriptional regulator [Aliiroseovarius halocynthiae]